MYLRRTERRTKEGTVGYLQLAHNEWDPVSKQSKVRVLYTFGREDQLDREAIVGLLARCSGRLSPMRRWRRWRWRRGCGSSSRERWAARGRLTACGGADDRPDA